MQSKIGKHLQEHVQKITQPIYIVFPEAYAGNIQDAIALLKDFPQIRPIPLSPAMLKTGVFDGLIDSLCEEFWQITLQYMKKQMVKGRVTQNDIDQYTLEQARKALHDPLNLALMMTRRGYSDAEVGGFEASTAEHSRRGLYIVNKDPSQDNIVCSVTVEFTKPHRVEDQHGGILREQNFLTIVDPAMGKPSMEYSFISALPLLKSMLQSNQISEQVYQENVKKLTEERNKHVQLKSDQAIAALRMHKVLTGEAPIGVFITHSTAGSDELSPYIQFLRDEVIPNIVKELAKRKTQDPLLEDAIFVTDECQVEATADPRIARKKAGKSQYAGYANVHVCASVVSANQHYKTFLAYGDIFSVICWSGFKKPIFDLSRSSPARDIMYSAMMSAVLAKDCQEIPDKEMWYQKAVEVYQNVHSYKVLVVNPGSTSTKVALFHNFQQVFSVNVDHTKDAQPMPPLGEYEKTADFRMGAILTAIQKQGCDLQHVSCVMGRGGVLDHMPSGIYEINDVMLQHLNVAKNGVHASNFGAILAKRLASQIGCHAYIADPVVVDEQSISAKMTGIKGVYRRSRWHALNQKYVAQKWAEENKKSYHITNTVVIHMGGGISVGAHYHGRVVDVNNALDGEGMFAGNRSGAISPAQTLELIDKLGKQKVYELITQKGGLQDLVGTQDFPKVIARAKAGEPDFVNCYNALVYQIAKQICSLFPAFYPDDVDQIIFTGGMAHNKPFVEDIVRYLPKTFRTQITIYPGEFEMEALATCGLKVLRGVEKPKVYTPETH